MDKTIYLSNFEVLEVANNGNTKSAKITHDGKIYVIPSLVFDGKESCEIYETINESNEYLGKTCELKIIINATLLATDEGGDGMNYYYVA